MAFTFLCTFIIILVWATTFEMLTGGAVILTGGAVILVGGAVTLAGSDVMLTGDAEMLTGGAEMLTGGVMLTGFVALITILNSDSCFSSIL